jgi:hypothetical protein
MKQNALAAHAVKLAGFALLGAAALAVIGCFYMPGLAGQGGTARASIGLSRALPANLTGTFTLIVGGPGMSTITEQYQPGTTTSGPLSIPSGVSRTFTLIANTPSVTLIGQQTVDLAPGETKDVTLTPVAAGSQIIVPDYWNQRIAQVSDMTGTGWKTLAYSDFDPLGAGGGQLWPWAVDIDSQGRIYVANNTVSGGSILGGLFRFDDIDHPTSVATVDTSSAFTVLAVDRMRGIVYYGDGGALYAKDVNNIGAGPTTVDLSDISAIPSPPNLNLSGMVAMAADEQGILYLAYPNSDFPGAIIKFDPNAPKGSGVLANSANSKYGFSLGASQASGIVVNGSYVYVSDSLGKKVIRFDRNLQFIDTFPGPANDQFNGPETFVATLNRKITVVDENGPGSVGDRLASFDDMTGANWTTFGTGGSGTNQFLFYTS